MGQPMQQTPDVDAIAREIAAARARNGDSITDIAAARGFARDVTAEHRRRMDAVTESRRLRTYDARVQSDVTLREIEDYCAWLKGQHPTLTVDLRGGWRDGGVKIELWCTAPYLSAILADADGTCEADADELARDRAREMGVTDGTEAWRLEEPYPGVMA